MHKATPSPAELDCHVMMQGVSLADDTMARVYHKVLKIANEWCGIDYYIVADTTAIGQVNACRSPNINHDRYYVKFHSMFDDSTIIRRNTSGVSVMMPSTPSLRNRRISSGSLTVQTCTRYPARRTIGTT